MCVSVCVLFSSYECLIVHCPFFGRISNVGWYSYGLAISVRRAQAVEKLAWAHYLQSTINKASLLKSSSLIQFKRLKSPKPLPFGSRNLQVHQDWLFYSWFIKLCATIRQRNEQYALDGWRREQRDFRHLSAKSELKYIGMSLWHLVFKDFAQMPLVRFFFPFVRQATTHWMTVTFSSDLYRSVKRLWHHLSQISFKDDITVTITLILHLEKISFGTISSLLSS